jgi:hypothetical protein
MVDTHTGLGMAIATNTPKFYYKSLMQIDAMLWNSFHRRIRSRYPLYGTISTNSAKNMDVQWNFHLPYNPIASGDTVKCNGLLKMKSTSIKKLISNDAESGSI